MTTPVIAGAIDAFAGAVEAGIVSKGHAYLATGTSSVLGMALDGIHTSPYISTGVGLDSQQGLMFASMSTTGASYKWFRDTLFGGENAGNTAYELMNREICKDAPTPSGIIYFPYLMGERSPIWDTNARAAFIGISASTTRGQLMRSVMEGTCFALRDNIEVATTAGADLTGLRVNGGCNNSDIWMKIKASVVNMPIEVPNVSFGGPAGLAMMMMPVTGESPSVQDAVAQHVSANKTYHPVAEWVDQYNSMYRIYKNLYEHMKEDFADLASIG